MKRASLTATAILLASQAANAGGLDRTGQPMGILFEDGNYMELSFSMTKPSISGTDTLTNAVPNVGSTFMTLGGGVKFDISKNLSLAIIAEQPFGSDIQYGGSSATTMLGGTKAIASSNSVTAIGRYKFSDNMSVHAGVRQQSISGDITLAGLAYGPLNGYNVALGAGSGTGFVVGGAFELPQYAARLAVTYNSEISHSLPTTETVGGVPAFGASPNTTVKSPMSVNVDFQTGINPKTLLFGSVRYAKWSTTKISPAGFDASVNPGTAGDSLSDIDDSYNITLGVGRKLSDVLSASVVVGYEPSGNDLVSPLAPTNGNYSIGVGAKYKKDHVTVSGGVRYTKLGDARPETGTPDTARATFSGNSALSVGMKIGFHF